MNVFSPDLKRTHLLWANKALDFSHALPLNIHIHRNHAFEVIESVIDVFLAHAGLKVHFTYSAYDDSLSFGSYMKANAALEIIYIDLMRYNLAFDVLAFIKERALALRALSKAPIMILLLDKKPLDLQALQSLQELNIFTFCLTCLYTQRESLLPKIYQHQHTLLEPTKEPITGTKLSNYGSLAIAQILGLKLIPALTLPHLKAIVCDLDNTLYSGILGEDGIQALELSPSHKALQEQILFYKKQGYLLALCSKNNEDDVKAMFAKRSDFPLKWEDFDHTAINWNPKSENLLSIAKAFNIGVNAMLFIDDNIAEITQVAHTGVKCLLASSPSEVLFSLYLYPGLTKFTLSTEDSLRSKDIAANTTRANLQSLDDEAYFKELALELSYSINHPKYAQRIYELLNKTNQFIANYTRPTLSQVQSYIHSKEHCVITLSMRDKLSDSGIIGVCIAQKCANEIHILDVVISCRALGRRLEGFMLNLSFSLCIKTLSSKSDEVLLHYQKGERNTPFLQALKQLTQAPSLIESNASEPQRIHIKIHKKEPKGLHIFADKESV